MNTMKQLLGVLLIFCCLQGIAQTDIIEYRSHSGNMSKFTKYSTPKIDGMTTNFGMVRASQVKNAALDTVLFISDSVSIMVTSEYCNSIHLSVPQYDKYGCMTREATLGRLWSAGTDTVLNHPLFSKNHSLDSIKKILSSTYNFKNSIDSVVFIGFDNALLEVQDGKKPLKDLHTKPDQEKGSFGLILLASVLLPGLLVYILGPLTYNWAKN
ncbi:MAG: hypothetical protein ACI837_000729 [Crocinitomicaceae bacterium]